jgi:putative salt-induced outer membrane protein YdiY
MNIKRMNRAAILVIAAGTLSTGLAYGDDTTALERLEKARIAFENAKAELQAAQAAVAQTTGTEVVVAADADATHRDQPEPEPAPEVPADPSSWADGWDWSASVGMTGSSGNTENFGARAAIGGERKTSKHETSIALSYIYGTSDGQKNTSRGELRVRNDWLTEGKWRYFAQGKYEYDEFQQWEHRISGAAGVGYEFIKDDKTTLLGRAGLGGSYELGGVAEEKLIPEGLLGLDWTYKYSENTTLTASTTYYPSFDDLGEFRWNNRAGLEIVMDKETGMTLTTGFEHRHDSDPGSGFKPNDVNYYMGLGWKF